MELNRRQVIRWGTGAALSAAVLDGCTPENQAQPAGQDSTHTTSPARAVPAAAFTLLPDVDAEAIKPERCHQEPLVGNANAVARAGYVLPPKQLLTLSPVSGQVGDGNIPTWWPPLDGTFGSMDPRFDAVAGSRIPAVALAWATAWFVRSGRAGGASAIDADADMEARAYADLAVTGRDMFNSFRADPPTVDSVLARLHDLPQMPGFPADERVVHRAVMLALERAYNVVWALRAGVLYTKPIVRRQLGYIAVCGSVDAPHRPVNVYAAPNQLDVPILAWGNEAIIRTVVWSTEPVTEAEPRWPLPIQDPVSGRQDLYERLVWVPDTDVILYLHGHSSRAEEGENLAKQLIADAKKRNRRLSVVAFDWPNCGYSSHLHPAQIGKQLPIDTKQGHNFFALDYYDEVVKQLVGQMHLEGRLLAVVGGSLGGNMVLRLAQQRARAENPWIRNLVAWNPAGAWSSYYFDPFKEAGALPRVRVRVEQEDNGLERRREYFEQVYASDVWIFGVPIAKKKIDQSDHWYRQDWLPCRDNLRVTSMLDRVEIYNTRFRTWHWRMAFEQLVISHLENDCAEFCPPQGKEPWRSMRGPLLLLDGKDDPDLHKPTVELAGKLASVRGMTGAHRTVNATGHSIHDERPAWLSGTILDFCPARR